MNEKHTIILTNKEIQLAALALEALGNSPLFKKEETQAIAYKLRQQLLEQKQRCATKTN